MKEPKRKRKAIFLMQSSSIHFPPLAQIVILHEPMKSSDVEFCGKCSLPMFHATCVCVEELIRKKKSYTYSTLDYLDKSWYAKAACIQCTTYTMILQDSSCVADFLLFYLRHVGMLFLWRTQSSRNFSPPIRSRFKNGFHMFFHLSSVKERGFCLVSQLRYVLFVHCFGFFGQRFSCEIVSLEKGRDLCIAPFQHGYNFRNGPFVHRDGSHG